MDRPHDKPDLRNKCYKTKNDKLHTTVFSRGDLSQETEEEREKRIQILRENRGRWVWDEEKRELVRAEEYYAKKQELDFPNISKWDSEYSLIATGYRMSKRELKNYCKIHNKVWENG